MRAKRPDSGFSLLEIIVVLAIAGIALTFYATYARKEANRTARENLASAAVQEMKGVMTFVLDSDAETALEAGNPLYSDEKEVNEAYHRRLTNKSNDKDTGPQANYFLWGDTDNSAKQQRYFFISSNCTSALKSEYEFGKEYLPCRLNSIAKNSAAMIDRVGFYAPDEASNSQNGDALAINRTDIIVAFKSDTKQDRLGFVDYYPQFSKALTNSGLIVSKAVVVYRSSSTANWQLVMQKNDPSTPVEFVDVVNNIGAVAAYTTGQFGVRFSFNMSDNEQGGSGSGGAGNTCWNYKESKVTLCYDNAPGTGAHGEEQILALNMTDTTNARGDQMAGTLKSNLVMENTARPVYLFKREYGGDLALASDGTPKRIVYKDDDGHEFFGDFFMGTWSSMMAMPGHKYDATSDYYRVKAYDAYELVTPSTSEYSGYEYYATDVTDDPDYTPNYSDEDKLSGRHRFAVQTCPKVEQEIILRDAEGNPLTDSDGKIRKVKVTRELFPQLSASLSSVSAYDNHVHNDIYTRPDKTRSELSSSEIVGMLGGITVQIEFALQEKEEGGIHPDSNQGSKQIFPNSKYVWIVTSTLGMYDAKSGQGKNIVNPLSVSYTITKWCSTVPQYGTPADLLSTTEYQ